MEETQLSALILRFIFFLSVVGILAATVAALAAALWQGTDPPAARLGKAMGLDAVPAAVVLLGGWMWSVLAVLLFTGLAGLILDIATQPAIPHTAGSRADLWDFRFKLAQLVALTTVLGAVVALPVTLSRLKLSREQTRTAQAALFNQKISEAAADLYAQRQVTKAHDENDSLEYSDVWEDDIVRRNSAIDRLLSLVQEDPSIASRVGQMLIRYVRELGKDFLPTDPPDFDETDTYNQRHRWQRWAKGLTPPRSDLESAIQTVGKIATIEGVDPCALNFNLGSLNLQGFDLRNLSFPPKTDFTKAHLQGARFESTNAPQALFSNAFFQGTRVIDLSADRAVFWNAKLQAAWFVTGSLQESCFDAANLSAARFVKTNLRYSSFQYSNLHATVFNSSDMRDVFLSGISADPKTNFETSRMRGAGGQDLEREALSSLKTHLNDIYSDETSGMHLPEPQFSLPNPPAHWSSDMLEMTEFATRWKAWQRLISSVPDKPAIPVVPQNHTKK